MNNICISTHAIEMLDFISLEIIFVADKLAESGITKIG